MDPEIILFSNEGMWNKETKYKQNYKDLITSIFRKENQSIYILTDINEKIS